MNKTKPLIALAAAAGLAFGGTAAAGHDRHAGYAYAKVVSAEPIVRLVEVSHPEQQCWDEEVYRSARSEPDYGGALIGGIVGGVVGNRFGGGNGKKVATVAGTLLGAAVGNELSQERRRGGYTTIERRCETVRVRHTEERIVGYDVRYRYNGRIYSTRTDEHPGKRIKVQVSVKPVG